MYNGIDLLTIWRDAPPIHPITRLPFNRFNRVLVDRLPHHVAPLRLQQPLLSKLLGQVLERVVVNIELIVKEKVSVSYGQSVGGMW